MALLSEALSLDEQDRAGFVEKVRRDDPTVADELGSLLEAHRASEEASFMSQGLDGSLMKHAEPVANDPNAETVTGIGSQEPSSADFSTILGDSIEFGSAAPVGSAPGQPVLIDGDYELINELGHGGMGIVYSARQLSLNRTVALKLIPTRMLTSAEHVARFRIEAEAAGGLSHPGIVPVLNVGEANGVHYYAMDLITGSGDLKGLLDPEAPVPPRRAAEIMESVCRAVQHAHDRAVIHRDIKPANILLDNDGRPHLTDFGLAKLLDAQDDLTMTGTVMGTASYMAPEQADGKNHLISTATDVYSLGATLYALLAGRPPFEEENYLATAQRVIDSPPPALNPDLPIDLRVICEKCLEKRPQDRYGSAGALADDLRSYLGGFPISARPVGTLGRFVGWSRRNPKVAALAGAVAASLVLGTVVSLGFAWQATVARNEAESLIERLAGVLTNIYTFAADEVQSPKLKSEIHSRSIDDFSALENAPGYATALAETRFALARLKASEGESEQADALYGGSLKTYKARLDSDPDDTEALIGASSVLAQLATEQEKAYRKQNDAVHLDRWQKHAIESLDYRRRAYQKGPGTPELARLLASSEMNLGLVQLTRAERIIDKASDSDRQLLREERTEIKEQMELSGAAFEEAQRVRDQALKASNTAADSETSDTLALIRRDLGKGYVSLADLAFARAQVSSDRQQMDQRLGESLDYSTKAVEIFVSLTQEQPSQEIQKLLAQAYERCARDLKYLQETGSAVEQYERLLAVYRRLILMSPRNWVYRDNACLAQTNLAMVLLENGDTRGYEVMQQCRAWLFESLIVDATNEKARELLVGASSRFAYKILDFAKAKRDSSLRDMAARELRRAAESLESLPDDTPGYDESTRKAYNAQVADLLERSEKMKAESLYDAI